MHMQASRFSSVIGHADILHLLESSLMRPAAAYLFYGPAHVGKRTVAELFMKGLLGVRNEESLLSQPDFFCLEPQEGKRIISVEQVREFRERAVLRPVKAERSVLFFPSADQLNEQGMNALLKVVEEPPAQAVFVMLAEDLVRIPKTIQSRSVMLHFHRVPVESIRDAMKQIQGFNNGSNLDALDVRGLPGLLLGDMDGGNASQKKEAMDLVLALLAAASVGSQLEAVEQVAKWCEAQDDSLSAWRMWCDLASRSLIEKLPTSPQILPLAWGILEAMRAIGSPISPRLSLEAAITQQSHLPPVVSHLPRPTGVVYLP